MIIMFIHFIQNHSMKQERLLKRSVQNIYQLLINI